jgi:cytochrome P450 / NADPH-cytochrome P450 reductase
MALAIVLQRFNLRLDDPSYFLQMHFNLTIKPKDLFIKATLRGGLDATSLEHALNSPSDNPSSKTNGQTSQKLPQSDTSGDRRISIIYGSNTGTCEALARKLAVDAKLHGFSATVSALDTSADSLPSDQPVIILTASYEGQPPDNGVHFVEWLASLSGDELKGTNYAVFGCGHRKVPSLQHTRPSANTSQMTGMIPSTAYPYWSMRL